MIIVPGTLFVDSHQREGKAVKSSWLECSIGRFNVKYLHLNSLQDGQYKGFFTIAQIIQGCYDYNGKYYFEVEAILNEIAFTYPTNSLTDVPSLVKEKRVEKTSDNKEPLGKNKNTLLEEDAPDDEDLFGSLWPLKDQVKLDTTYDRSRIRAQCERLKQLGYLHNAEEQVWYKAV